MALGSNGYRAAVAKHPLTPVRISSLRGTVGSSRLPFFRQTLGSTLSISRRITSRLTEAGKECARDFYYMLF